MYSLWLCILGLAIGQVCLVSCDNVYKQTINFSDQQKFADLSVFNFDRGLSTTYQYSLVARPGKKVHIYFLTVLTKNANVSLYDGVDANARQVHLGAVNKIDNSSTEVIPVQIKSIGTHFYLKVTPFSTDPKVLQDFQAIATDFVQPSVCGALVRACGTPRAFPKVPIVGSSTPCIHIIRSIDLTNDMNTRFELHWIETDTLIYKGISMSNASKLLTLEVFAAYNEKNIILQHTSNMTLEFAFIPDGTTDAIAYQAMNTGYVESFMTQDYIPPRPIGALQVVQHQYAFIPTRRVDSLRFKFLSDIGSANVQVTYMHGNTPNRTTTYTQSTLPPTLVSENYDEVLISYSCIGSQCTGMYGTVQDADWNGPQ